MRTMNTHNYMSLISILSSLWSTIGGFTRLRGMRMVTVYGAQRKFTLEPFVAAPLNPCGLVACALRRLPLTQSSSLRARLVN